MIPVLARRLGRETRLSALGLDTSGLLQSVRYFTLIERLSIDVSMS
jgi:hypothetical protein